jgi:hypothetical protein
VSLDVEAPEAKCRGCGQDIWLRVYGWETRDGLVVCVKVPLSEVGNGVRPDYVEHIPMPAGLAGAPVLA